MHRLVQVSAFDDDFAVYRYGRYKEGQTVDSGAPGDHGRARAAEEQL